MNSEFQREAANLSVEGDLIRRKRRIAGAKARQETMYPEGRGRELPLNQIDWIVGLDRLNINNSIWEPKQYTSSR